MIEMGMSPEKAKEMVTKMQRNEGFLDLLSGPMQTLLSPIFGPLRSMASRPLEEKTGVPKEVFEAGAAMLMGRPRLGKMNTRAPLAERLHDAATENYTVAKSLPIEINRTAVENIADDIVTRLNQKGFRDTTAGRALKTVEYLKEPLKTNSTIADVDSVRSALGHISRERDAQGFRTAEAGAASHAVEMLNDHIAGLNPSQIASGSHLLPALLNEMKEARGNWAAYVRSKIIEDLVDKGYRGAGASGAGANIENQIRQKFNSILNKPKERQRYNDAELDMMRDMVMGSSTQNALRKVGKLAPTGIVSAAGSMGLGALVGGTTGMEALPIIGTAAKWLADSKTKKAAEAIRDATAKRSPLYEEWARNSPVVPKANLKWLLGAPRRQEEENQ